MANDFAHEVGSAVEIVEPFVVGDGDGEIRRDTSGNGAAVQSVKIINDEIII